MAIVLASSLGFGRPGDALPRPANSDGPATDTLAEQKILAWLARMAVRHGEERGSGARPASWSASRFLQGGGMASDDWSAIACLCGHPQEDFATAGSGLPLTAAEIDHFRRDHREVASWVGRDFQTAKSELPSPLTELYGLYQHRARKDVEATLFLAQATGSTRVARVMADLLAVGAFANAMECVTHMAQTYAVSAAFDTAALVDHANGEAARRLTMPIDHPAHLLKLAPDELGVLAANIVENHLASPSDFLAKANILAEARQDVARLPVPEQFTTALEDGDLPMSEAWTIRIGEAYARLFEGWNTDAPGDEVAPANHNLPSA